MAYFAITYDLVKDKDYKTLIDELKRLSCERIALSVWFADLGNTCEEVRDWLADFVDKDDKLVVVEFDKRPRYTRGFETGCNWITSRFS